MSIRTALLLALCVLNSATHAPIISTTTPRAAITIMSSSLHLAAINNDLPALRQLMELHLTLPEFNINAPDDTGKTALHYAALHGHPQATEILLAHGANARSPDHEHQTPLTYASANGEKTAGHAAVTAMLLETISSYDDTSPLHWAVLSKDRALMKKLISKGISIWTRSRYHEGLKSYVNQSAIKTAMMMQDTEMFTFLIAASGETDTADRQLAAMLIGAAADGDLETVEQLLQHRSSSASGETDNPQQQLETMLNLATTIGGLEVGEMSAKLLQQHRDEIVALHGSTPLIAAAKSGHLEIVQALLAGGAEVNLVTDGNNRSALSALIAAAKSGHLEIVQALLASGAEVNLVTDGNNRNALMAAAKWGHLEIVKVLLEHGASIDTTASIEKNPLIAAVFWGHHEVVELLLQYGADANTVAFPNIFETVLMLAIVRGYDENVELLLQYGADANAVTPAGETALTQATEWSWRVVELLLQSGASYTDAHRGVILREYGLASLIKMEWKYRRHIRAKTD